MANQDFGSTVVRPLQSQAVRVTVVTWDGGKKNENTATLVRITDDNASKPLGLQPWSCSEHGAEAKCDHVFALAVRYQVTSQSVRALDEPRQRELHNKATFLPDVES